VLGTLLVIFNARRAVLQETESTAALALQLIEVAYANAKATRNPDPSADIAAETGGEDRLRERLRGLAGVRHLEVLLIDDGRAVELARPEAEAVTAPRWFVSVVAPAAMELKRTLDAGTEVVVRADPADEIAESWDDAWPLLLLVLGVAVVANGLFYVVIGRWLGPVERIVAAMDGIEQGDYRSRLPAFQLPELGKVATQFNRMAEVLERSREQNRYLAEQTIAIQEDERRVLARELHDELGQSIAAVKAVAASLAQAQETGGGAVDQGAATITQIANQMYGVVRGMLRRLRPVLLDEFGLVRALENLIDGWNERHADVFCRLAVDGRVDDLGDSVDISIYRVVQECLTNVAKHAAASEVTIELERVADGRVRLRVHDDGVGFAPATAPPGLGLLGIRERIEALQGSFSIEAAPGHGVALDIELPVDPGR
ncbi:MAG TPA: ATP-binding protein, partial [Gammaproteobacteria bacterium]